VKANTARLYTAVFNKFFGIYIDSDLSSACRRMSSGLSQVALQSCVSCAAFVDLFRRLFISRWLLPLYSRLDYGNATLAGLQACLLNRLQTVFNAAARSIAGLRLSEHITNALASFYRL